MNDPAEYTIRVHTPRTRTFTFKRWTGDTETVEAEAVTFTDGGALLFTTGDRLILAVNNTDWNNVREVTE